MALDVPEAIGTAPAAADDRAVMDELALDGRAQRHVGNSVGNIGGRRLRRSWPSAVQQISRRLRVVQRGEAKQGDLVALAAQDPEPEAVEHELLAHLRYPPRLVQHQPGDRRGLLVGQAPAELAVRSEEHTSE